ncbi:hypothetical protein N1851_021571 [Merluccius polli]|uniref:Uncharacterized protein n=1 Tax=Merluccius polli TaxID=89951 RepID=A0AA47MJG5_MERPO|nr:hypothetical protein N1851_021571 [Merluccius polli]
MLKATTQTGIDPHLALLHLRNTPITGLKYSPAQLLMGHVLRSDLPASTALLQPATPVNVQQGLRQRQLLQKHSYDKGASPLSPFREGERVCMKTTKGWQPATVERVRDEPRSYDIITPAGAQYRRNRRHLRPDRVAGHRDNDEITCPDSDADQEIEKRETETQDTSEPQPEVETDIGLRSRVGRSVKLPARLQDYVL